MERYFPWGYGGVAPDIIVNIIHLVEFTWLQLLMILEVWDCQIEADQNGDEIIGKLGDVEHLRKFLPNKRTKLKANRLYWMTDRTPHESLPLEKKTHRQFFRLVTHRVSVWYEDHSTKNPNGVVPDPKMTRIVRGSKFDGDYVTIVG